MTHIPDLLIMPVAFEWNGRTWVSITNAMTTQPMQMYIAAKYCMSLDEAYHVSLDGGTFDVSGNHNFTSYYVHKQSAGMVRLFRATDIRQLKDGKTW